MVVENVIDALASAVLVAALLTVGAAGRNRELARSWRLLAAAGGAGCVVLWAVWRLGDVGSIVLPLVAGTVAGLTSVAATVVRSAATRERLPEGRGSTRWAAASLFVVRAAIGVGVLGCVAVAIFGGGIERRIDDRVTIEKGWFRMGVPGARTYDERAGKWYPNMVRLNLTVMTPRVGSLCPLESVKIREDKGGTLYAQRPGDCAAAKQVRRQYGGDPVSVTVHKLVIDPPPSVGRKINALIGLGWALWLLVGLCVERLLTHAVRRRPFGAAGVRWLRVLAASLAAALLGMPLLADRLVAGLLGRYLPQVTQPAFKFSLWPLLVVALLLALAEIWRLGIRLQEDAEATV